MTTNVLNPMATYIRALPSTCVGNKTPLTKNFSRSQARIGFRCDPHLALLSPYKLLFGEDTRRQTLGCPRRVNMSPRGGLVATLLTYPGKSQVGAPRQPLMVRHQLFCDYEEKLKGVTGLDILLSLKFPLVRNWQTRTNNASAN